MRERSRFLLSSFLVLSFNVHAQDAAQIIPPVVVKKQSKPSLSSGGKITISHEDIYASGMTTLAQVLQDLGNVQLQDLSGNNSQVLLGLRGFGANASSNTLMLINGIPLTNPDLAPPDLHVIPLHDIQAIEITAGSESVLYGDQAVGGVINILTHDQAKEKARLSCATGSYIARNCDLTWQKQINRFNLGFTATANRTDNYREHNHYEQAQLIGKMAYRYATGKLYIDLNLAKENMQYPGALTAAEVRANRRASNNSTDFFRDTSSALSIREVQNINEANRLQIDFARRDMQGNGVLSVPFTQTRTVYYLKPQLKSLIRHITWINGLDIQHDNYHNANSLFGTADNNEQQWGAFTLANVPVNEKTALSLGMRGALQTSHLRSYSNNDNVNRALATTLGATYQYKPEMNFYLRRAGSFRFPKADENSMTATGINNLRTQRGDSYETGLMLNKKDYAFTAGIYQLNLKDEIAFDPTQTATEPFGSNRNLAPTVRRGFNLSGRATLLNRLTFDSQYNYVNARFQHGVNAGNRIPLVSENIIHAGLSHHFLENWSAYYEAIFTGAQYPANDDANVAGKIGGYTIYNFNVRYTWKAFTATLHLNNLTNKAYYFYSVYQSSMVPSESFYPAPERNVMLTLDWLFQ